MMHAMGFDTHGLLLCLFGVLLAFAVIALAWIDIKHLILPNFLNGLLALMGVMQSLVLNETRPIDAALGALLGSALLGFLGVGFRHLRGYEGLGMGDVKLAGATGFWVGWQGLPFMLLTASVLALAFILARAVWRGDFAPKWRLPFGPFLGGGALLSWVLIVAS